MAKEVDLDKLELTDKQRIFCQEYIIDWNATRAAKEAGYSEKTATETGCENLRKPHIKEYIDSIKDNLEEQAGLTKLKVVLEQKKLAFSSIAHLHDTWITRKEFESLGEAEKACISEISTQTRQELNAKDKIVQVDYVKIKLYDKQKALDSIAKMMGYNEPDKISHLGEVSVKTDLSKLDTETLEKLYEAGVIEKGE